MATLSWPLRPDSRYKPKAPKNSFTRSGYQRTSTNPRGYHWGMDIPCPRNTIIQLPEKAKLIDKGWGGDTGYWMEWRIETGSFRGRHIRFFHMEKACGFSVGTIKTRKYAVGRSGNTGNSTAPHLHFEIGAKRWDSGRDPRYNPYPYLLASFKAKDW